MNPPATNLALDATRRYALSARPDAPVVPGPPDDRRRRTPLADPARRATAGLLRRLADRVEPRRAAPCHPATS
jgi:hypothetical protein